MPLILFISLVITGIIVAVNVLRHESDQQHTKVYSVSEFNKEFKP